MLALTGSKCAWEWGIFMGQSPMEYGRKVFQCHTSIRQDMDLHPNKKRTRSVSLVHLFSLIKNSVLRAVKLNHIPLRCERERKKREDQVYYLSYHGHGPWAAVAVLGPPRRSSRFCSNCCPSTRTRTRETRIRNSVCCLLYQFRGEKGRRARPSVFLYLTLLSRTLNQLASSKKRGSTNIHTVLHSFRLKINTYSY